MVKEKLLATMLSAGLVFGACSPPEAVKEKIKDKPVPMDETISEVQPNSSRDRLAARLLGDGSFLALDVTECDLFAGSNEESAVFVKSSTGELQESGDVDQLRDREFRGKLVSLAFQAGVGRVVVFDYLNDGAEPAGSIVAVEIPEPVTPDAADQAALAIMNAGLIEVESLPCA